jgi:hypothetical protein
VVRTFPLLQNLDDTETCLRPAFVVLGMSLLAIGNEVTYQICSSF